MTKYCLLFLCIAVFACKGVEKRYVIKAKQVRLTKENMYDEQMAYNAVFDAEESGSDSVKNLARQYFLKGVDLYKNKKETGAGIAQFKKSILTFPDAKTYYELGNALVDLNAGNTSLDEAIKSYEVADYLKFDAKPILYYRIANALSRLDGEEYRVARVIARLGQAFRAGFTDTAMIRKNPHLAPLMETEDYKDMVSEIALLKSNGNAQSMFTAFANSFPQINGSFNIAPEQVAMKDYERSSISYDFAVFIPEMENVSFGRDVSHDFFKVGKLAQTANYTVLVYSSVSFMSEYMQPVYTRIVTYTNDGKIIASRVFSSQFSAEKIRTGKYANGEFTVEDYKRNWAQPIDKVSFEENKVKSLELLANATFAIQADGQIVVKEASKNYKESIAIK